MNVDLAIEWPSSAFEGKADKDLYKESEVSQESEEFKDFQDGGGGWWVPYILKEKGSYKKLFFFARATRGIEVENGIQFSREQLLAIFEQWEVASKSFLRPGHDYFEEFLGDMRRVKYPKNFALRTAFEKSKGTLTRRP